MKSKSNFLYLAALAFSVCCCSPKGDGSVSEVVVNGNTMTVFTYSALNSNEATVPLSSLVEDCYLVQLETHEDAYFNPVYTTVTEKYILIKDGRGEPYKLFDRSGKFLGAVGAFGGGPENYVISPYDAIVDDENDLIYLAPFIGNNILVYNTSCQFVKNITAPQQLRCTKIFLFDGTLTAVHMSFPNDKAIAIQFDVNTGEVLKELAPPAHLIEASGHFGNSELFNTRNVPGIFDILYGGNDTLYHFDVKNNTFLPVFMLTDNSSEKRWMQYFQVNKDLIMTWMSGSKLHATDLKNKLSSNINVVNDYYGNIPAPMSVIHARNGYWVHNIQPEDLMEAIEKRLAESSCTNSDRQILTKTLSTLKEGANNVVFIGKLKIEVKAKLW